MATIKVKLNVCRTSKSGKYPVVIRLIHKKQCRLIATGVKIEPECFDSKRENVICPAGFSYRRKELCKMNRCLQDMRKMVADRIERLGAADYSVDDIVSWCKYYNSLKCIFSYIEHMIEVKMAVKKYGIAHAYRATLNSLKSFCGSTKICFTDIDIQFIRDYELYLRQQSISSNTIAYYMRNLQTAYNRAEIDGIFKIPPQGSPFKKIRIKPMKTIKRALTTEQIRAIASLDLHASPVLEFTRDMFMASFYLRGIPFVDLVHLLRENVVNGTIFYYRRKTGMLLSVEIIPRLQSLIDKYTKEGDPYLFSGLMLRADYNDEEAYKAYRRALFYYNRRLKQVGKLAGLKIPLTGYMVRHSWATIAKNKGVSTAIISEGLGHSSERITMIYLKSFDNGVINQVNLMVSEL